MISLVPSEKFYLNFERMLTITQVAKLAYIKSNDLLGQRSRMLKHLRFIIKTTKALGFCCLSLRRMLEDYA